MPTSLSPVTPAPDAELLLRDYYRASRNLSDLEERLLQSVAPVVDRQLYSWHIAPGDMDDWRNAVNFRVLEALQKSASSKGKPIGNLRPYARRTTLNLLHDRFRKCSPRRQMSLSVEDLLRPGAGSPGLLARWEQGGRWLIGLPEWVNRRDFEATAQFQGFLDFDDASDEAFLRGVLNGRDPADPDKVPLADLVVCLLRWLDTPLEKADLTEFLLRLRPPAVLQIVYTEDMAQDGASADEWLLPGAEGGQEAAIMQLSFWQWLNAQKLKDRAIILLHWEPSQIAELCGVTAERVPQEFAEALRLSPQAARLYWSALAMPDDQIAQALPRPPGTLPDTIQNIQTQRSRALKRFFEEVVKETPRKKAKS